MNRQPGNTFLLVQAMVDLGVVTTIVHFAGQPQSAFPALYVLVVAAYALLMPPVWGAVTADPGVARCILGDTLWTHSARPDAAFWAQMVVFNRSSRSSRCWGTGCARRGWSRRPSPPSCSGSGSRPTTSCGTSAPGVLTVDGLGRLAFINPTAERLLDLDGEALIGLPVLDQLKTRSVGAVGGGRRGDPERAEDQPRGGHGPAPGRAGLFPIGLSTTTFRQEAQDAPSVTAIFTDISDLKEVQELQARAERLEAVAALSASLAHEIRNPLASIRSSVEQLARVAPRRRGRALPRRR